MWEKVVKALLVATVVLSSVCPAAAGSGPVDLDTQYVTGFRVQIHAGTDAETARAFAESARQLFDEDLYVICEKPHYKVQIGDCREREDAAAILKKAIELGFEKVWVVSALVPEKPFDRRVIAQIAPVENEAFEIPERNDLIEAEPAAAPPSQPMVEPQTESSASPSTRFRVQFFASKDRAAAERVAADLREITGEPIMIEFDKPYHRVRVGDFRSQTEAWKFKSSAAKHGFQRAWIVQESTRG